MTNFFLGVGSALVLISIIIDITDGAVGKASNKINAGILDCVEEQIITGEQAHRIFEHINKIKP